MSERKFVFRLIIGIYIIFTFAVLVSLIKLNLLSVDRFMHESIYLYERIYYNNYTWRYIIAFWSNVTVLLIIIRAVFLYNNGENKEETEIVVTEGIKDIIRRFISRLPISIYIISTFAIFISHTILHLMAANGSRGRTTLLIWYYSALIWFYVTGLIIIIKAVSLLYNGKIIGLVILLAGILILIFTHYFVAFLGYYLI